MSSYQPVLQIMEKAAHKAARGMLRDFNEVEKLQVSRKGLGDFVSAADLRAEDTIVDVLRTARPDYGVLSEECGEIEGAGEFRWVIDPLDGTSNFLHGIPHFCISIGLEHHTAKGVDLVAGLIFQPLTHELFTAAKNEGAYHNGARIKVSTRKELSESLVGTGTSAIRTENAQFKGMDQAIGREVMGLRCMGCAALDLAYVASGKLEAFWQIGLKPWDMAAGIVMIREAGGVVRDLTMQGDPYATQRIVACNSNLAPSLDKLMAKSMRQQASLTDF